MRRCFMEKKNMSFLLKAYEKQKQKTIAVSKLYEKK